MHGVFFFLLYLINDFLHYNYSYAVSIFPLSAQSLQRLMFMARLSFLQKGRKAKAIWALFCSALNGLGIAVFCRQFADLFISFMAAHGQEEREREIERERKRKRGGERI